MNHEATTKFMEHVNPNIKERIKLVICLDSIVNQGSRTLNIIKSSLAEKDIVVHKFVQEMQKASEAKNVKLRVKEDSAV